MNVNVNAPPGDSRISSESVCILFSVFHSKFAHLCLAISPRQLRFVVCFRSGRCSGCVDIQKAPRKLIPLFVVIL